MKIVDTALDFLFPRHCLGCGQLMPLRQPSYVCVTCTAGIVLQTTFACAFCAKPTMNARSCPACRKNHQLDQLFVTAPYDNPLVEKIVKTMKYNFIYSLGPYIASLMQEYAQNNLRRWFDSERVVVTAVPLHRVRQNWRGFNQAEIIARPLAHNIGLPYHNIVRRYRPSPPQADISDKEQRIKNTENIFQLDSDIMIKNKTIILIDDVATTSSTLNSCAEIFKQAGASEIIGFVFARGTMH